MSYTPTNWQTGDTITAEKLNNMEGGIEGGQNLVEITYSALKTLRDNGLLVAGTKYRITDYVTIINGTYDLSAIGAEGYLHHAVSAGHAFDLIVEAVGAGELSEIAQAAPHSGDTYFANADLGGWEVKYCLDNDTSRFSWASSSGKGVIYGLKDEWNNYCGYDFKNIMFPRYALKLADATADFTPTDTGLVYDASTQPNRYGSLYQIYTALQSYMETGTYVNPWVQTGGYVGDRVTVNNYDFAVGANILGVVQFPTINETYLTTFAADLYYTFDWFDDGTHYDASLNGNTNVPVRENYIALETDSLYATVADNNVIHGLGGNVFENNAIETGSSSVARCNSNRIETGSPFNTFGNCVFDTKLSELCYGNTFGSACSDNTFERGCYGNTFGYSCNSNTFGSACNNNTFGNSCYDNTFGNECGTNTFVNHCYKNTFGNNCYDNTFWNECGGNTFGKECYGNTLWAVCLYNTFGRECAYISVERSDNGACQFYHICDNVQGAFGSPITIRMIVNRTFETWVGYNSSGVLKTWCPMDAAT